MEIQCPVCTHKAGKYKRVLDRFSIYKCAHCGLEYTSPIPSDAQLQEFYTTYKDIRADDTIVHLNAQENIQALQKYGFNEHSTLLDFGCGDGIFLDTCNCECYGVELSPSENENIFPSLDALPVKNFDFITLWGVLEHINHLHEVMHTLISYLKEGGYLIMTTVDAEGVIPYYYKPPEHLTYWTHDALEILAHSLKCSIQELRPYTMYQYSSIYLQRLLSRTPQEYAASIKQDVKHLPEIIKVPTNELFTVFQKDTVS